MAQYVLMLTEDDSGYENQDPAVFGEIMAAHDAFSQKWGDKVLGGKALQPGSTATSVRADGAGSWTVTDGPFVEAKEVIGGYYLVEAADLDEAIEMAKDVPTPFGGIEIRPAMIFD